MTDFEERVFEVEKCKTVNGREVFAKAHLNTVEDGPAWFESRTGRSLTGLEDVTLPVGWRWSSNWKFMVDNGTDSEGWIRDGMIRRRKWSRKREKMSSAGQTTVSTGGNSMQTLVKAPQSVASSSTSAPAGKSTGVLDEKSILRVASEAFQRLDATIQKVSMANDRGVVERLAKEARQIINEGQEALSQLAGFEKPTTRAARIKLSNDFLRDQERLQRIVSEALTRVPVRPTLTAEATLGRKASASFAPSSAVQYNDVDSLVTLEKQRQELQRLEQVHRQVLSTEIQSDAAAIEERHKELVSIQGQVQAVNRSMQQVAELLGEQDHSIQTLVANTSKANANLEKGLSEVKKAEQYQEEGSNCCIS